jgi:hypothetical protein
MRKGTKFLFLTALVGSATVAFGDSVNVLLNAYKKEAIESSANFEGFSADRGRVFYVLRHATKNGEISCATCHTDDPRRVGRTRANKDIEAMAKSVNQKRFTDPVKVEKWFERNCDDVLRRPCAPSEKGDFITYMLSVK